MKTRRARRFGGGVTASRTIMIAAAALATLPPPAAAGQENTDRARNVGVALNIQQVQACQEGVLVGEMGISGLNCRGECTLTLDPEGTEKSWAFTTEPAITGVLRGGPADGILQAGDILVAIDGVPITTREGGERLARVEPGQRVTLLVRRDGRREEVTLTAAAQCQRPPNVVPVPPRLLPRPPRPDTALVVARVDAVVAPRIRIAPGVAIADTAHIRVAPVVSWSVLPRGKLGFSFSCGPCSSTTDPETGETIWSFTGPIEVIGVTSGGPAALAGIQRGDVITTINAEPIESEEGGVTFSRLVPGEEVTLTVVKRSGEEIEVELVPVAEMVVVAPTAAVAVADVEPVVVEALELPLPPPLEPHNLVLRYSGTLGPAEIEVRGGPVGIEERVEEGIIIIVTQDARIQIRVPGSGRQREDTVSR